MKLISLEQQLEEYFAKKYTDKYVEFGGYFHIRPFQTSRKSPMQAYFSSGKYKELNDPELDKYWKEIKKRQFYWGIFAVVVVILFYLLMPA